MSQEENKKLGDLIPDKIKNISIPTNPFHKKSKSSAKSQDKPISDTAELPDLEEAIKNGMAEQYSEAHAGERAANMLKNHQVSEENTDESDEDEYEDEVYSEPTIMFNPMNGSSYVNPDYAYDEGETEEEHPRHSSTRPRTYSSNVPPSPPTTPQKENNGLLGVMVAIVVLLVIAIVAVIVFGVSNRNQSETTTTSTTMISTTYPTEYSTTYSTTRYTTTEPPTTTTTAPPTTHSVTTHRQPTISSDITWSTRAARSSSANSDMSE